MNKIMLVDSVHVCRGDVFVCIELCLTRNGRFRCISYIYIVYTPGCIHSWLAEILLRLLHLPADTDWVHHAGSWQNVCLDLQGAWAWCGVLDESTTGPSL